MCAAGLDPAAFVQHSQSRSVRGVVRGLHVRRGNGEAKLEAIGKAGYAPGRDIALAIDAAATEFYHDGAYQFEGKPQSSAEMTAIYLDWLANYPLVSVEDRWPKRTGPAGRPSPPRLATGSRWSATTFS